MLVFYDYFVYNMRMDIIALETYKTAEKYFAPPLSKDALFALTEYGQTYDNTPCYQLRLNSPVACLQYVVSGCGTVICDDKIFTVNSGDTFLLPMGTTHIYYSTPENHFARIWINFNGELAKSLLSVFDLENQIVFRKTDTQALLTEMHRVCNDNPTAHDYEQASALVFFKTLQFLATQKTEEPESNAQIEPIRLYIACHIMENIKISEIAKHFYISEEHLIRLFKKNYHITPHQYILQSKLRFAMIMLRSTKDSIEEISTRLNFSDPRHFSAQFKKHVGIRPLAYRKASRGKFF